MENKELFKRAEDLRARAGRSGSLTHTGFLTPAERYELEAWAKHRADCRLLFHGGGPDCERTVAFFLPDWMEEDAFDPAEAISAMRISAFFGEPGHRDYLGAILGMGIGREWLGDIRVEGKLAYVFCLPSVLRHLLSLEKVGRVSVKAEELPLADVPASRHRTQKKSFSVQSMRLDAIVGGMFNLSRTEAARQISAGNVSVNYQETLKTDHTVREGDILSLRGAGKGSVTGTGGTSRKGRLFVYAEIYQ